MHDLSKGADVPVRVIPVLDLKDGLAVRGVAGNRAEYRPVETILAQDASPAAVARAFVEKLSLEEAYVADLDAIAGAEPAWDLYRRLIEIGLHLWVDAGITNVNRARSLSQFKTGGVGFARVIAGLESLDGIGVLGDVLDAIGPERLVFSLDLRGGRPIAAGTGWRGCDAWDIVEAVIEASARSIIVLDLAQVGMNRGVVTEALCRQIRDRAPHAELVSGGGVRGPEDLRRLADAGCDAALVASALHDGRITIKDLGPVARNSSGIDALGCTSGHT